MNKKNINWKLPGTGALLFATAVTTAQTAQADQQPELVSLNSTNRVTLSLRFGLNITGKFTGIGTGLNPSASRRTPHGNPYNYDDGYVYPDASGSHDGLTWYWGYDNSASQVDRAGHPDTIALDRTTASGIPSTLSQDVDSSSPGFELAYNRELGVKEDWHQMRYGVEAAFNYLPVSFNVGGVFNATLTQRTDYYNFTPGTTPPTATPGNPYQGSYGGPGFVIGSTPSGSTTTVVPGATLSVQDSFNANLWGFRLGPYVEVPLTEKLNLQFSGGLAVGLLDANASWKETVTLPAGGGSTTASGGGNDFDALWGGYLNADANYQLNQRWGVAAGVQFQDLGTYSHSFGGRTAELDLSRSIFLRVGVSYSF